MRKKLMALCLAGVLIAGSMGGIPVQAYAMEGEEGIVENAGSEEIVYEEALPDEPATDSLVADNGDVLTAIVPYTEEEKTAMKEAENKIPAKLIDNLAEYVPDGQGQADFIEALGAREEITGIVPITPSEGEVHALVIMSEFKDLKYTDEFKNDLSKSIFANDPAFDPEYTAAHPDEMKSETANKDYPKDSLRGYYQRASFGNLKFTGEITSFVSEHDREWYNQFGKDNTDNTILYQDAVNSWVNSVISEEAHKNDNKTDLEYLDERLSEFDLDGDMKIDACYFACAGGNTGWATRWWSYRTASDIVIGSYRLPYLVQVVDSASDYGVAGKDVVGDYIETFIHETGHYLGLIDYYSYDSNEREDMQSDKKVMTRTMMDCNDADHDGFAKMLLGWIPKERVWVITDKQVYDPEKKKWEDYTGKYTLALNSYARTGDMALIIPHKDNSEGWNSVYDQFIMVENYKNELNDTLKPFTTEENPPRTISPTEGLRFFHIYGRKNASGNGFIADNTRDTYIPLVSDYYCDSDEYMGVYVPDKGLELTPSTEPASSFYINAPNDGLLEHTVICDSGISVTNIVSAEGGAVSFDTSIANTSEGRPQIVEDGVYLFNTDADGACVRVTFDRPVNYIGGQEVAIYDYDASSNLYYTDEKWGTITEVRRSSSGKQYLRNNKELYFMLDPANFRFADGAIVIPAGSVVSDKGIGCEELIGSLSGIWKDAPRLTASLPGGLYDSEIEVTISGAPEGTKIYYTVDGTEPTTESTLYNGSVKINSNAVLKAVAYDETGLAQSARLYVPYTLEKVYFPGKDDKDQPTEKNITLDVGERYNILTYVWATEGVDTTAYYSSSDTGVALVDDYGMITARKEGTSVISIYTNNTANAPAKCTVTVTKGYASALREAVVKEYGINKAGEVMRQISADLCGQATLKEFADSYLDKVWVATVNDQTYTSKAIKPQLRVYKGIKEILQVEEDGSKKITNYTVTYKNNVNTGIASATVKFKGSYKGNDAVSASFNVTPANVKTELKALDMGVKYTGKLQTPKPVMLWTATGAKQAFSAKNFKVTYTDASGEELKGVQDEGVYTATISGIGKNFTGAVDITVKVQKSNFLDKITVINKTKSYTFSEGKPVTPVFGTDFTIKVPKGFDELGEKPFEDGKLEVTYLANTEPGKMAMIITPTDKCEYAGAKVVYLTIKKSAK